MSEIKDMKRYIIEIDMEGILFVTEATASNKEQALMMFGKYASEQLINKIDKVVCKEKEEPLKPFNLDSCHTIDLVTALIKRNGIELMDSKYKEVCINIDGEYQKHCYEQLKYSGKI